jgi:hypothetical protein
MRKSIKPGERPRHPTLAWAALPQGPDFNPVECAGKLTGELCLQEQFFSTLDSVIAAAKKEFSG